MAHATGHAAPHLQVSASQLSVALRVGQVHPEQRLHLTIRNLTQCKVAYRVRTNIPALCDVRPALGIVDKAGECKCEVILRALTTLPNERTWKLSVLSDIVRNVKDVGDLTTYWNTKQALHKSTKSEYKQQKLSIRLDVPSPAPTPGSDHYAGLAVPGDSKEHELVVGGAGRTQSADTTVSEVDNAPAAPIHRVHFASDSKAAGDRDRGGMSMELQVIGNGDSSCLAHQILQELKDEEPPTDVQAPLPPLGPEVGNVDARQHGHQELKADEPPSDVQVPHIPGPPETAVREIFENQRRYFSGWSSTLLPSDRYAWSTEDGKAVDASFSWTGGWKAGEWMYGFDFATARWHPEYRVADFVRRRRWTRAVQGVPLPIELPETAPPPEDEKEEVKLLVTYEYETKSFFGSSWSHDRWGNETATEHSLHAAAFRPGPAWTCGKWIVRHVPHTDQDGWAYLRGSKWGKKRRLSTKRRRCWQMQMRPHALLRDVIQGTWLGIVQHEHEEPCLLLLCFGSIDITTRKGSYVHAMHGSTRGDVLAWTLENDAIAVQLTSTHSDRYHLIEVTLEETKCNGASLHGSSPSTASASLHAVRWTDDKLSDGQLAKHLDRLSELLEGLGQVPLREAVTRIKTQLHANKRLSREVCIMACPAGVSAQAADQAASIPVLLVRTDCALEWTPTSVALAVVHLSDDLRNACLKLGDHSLARQTRDLPHAAITSVCETLLQVAGLTTSICERLAGAHIESGDTEAGIARASSDQLFETALPTQSAVQCQHHSCDSVLSWRVPAHRCYLCSREVCEHHAITPREERTLCVDCADRDQYSHRVAHILQSTSGDNTLQVLLQLARACNSVRLALLHHVAAMLCGVSSNTHEEDGPDIQPDDIPAAALKLRNACRTARDVLSAQAVADAERKLDLILDNAEDWTPVQPVADPARATDAAVDTEEKKADVRAADAEPTDEKKPDAGAADAEAAEEKKEDASAGDEETADAKIDKLHSIVSAKLTQDALDACKGEAVTIVLGPSGAGKSTVLNFLNGCSMHLNAAGHVDVSAESEEKEVFRIGHGGDSATLHPQAALIHGTVFVDCPGWGDTRGSMVGVANAVNILRIAQAAASVKILLVLGHWQFGNRNTDVRELIRSVRSLVGSLALLTEHKDCVLVAINCFPDDDQEQFANRLRDYTQEFNLDLRHVFVDPLGGGRDDVLSTIASVSTMDVQANKQLFRKPSLDSKEKEGLNEIARQLQRRILMALPQRNIDSIAQTLILLQRLALVDHGHVEEVIARVHGEAWNKLVEPTLRDCRDRSSTRTDQPALLQSIGRVHALRPLYPLLDKLEAEVRGVLDEVKARDVKEQTARNATITGRTKVLLHAATQHLLNLGKTETTTLAGLDVAAAAKPDLLDQLLDTPALRARHQLVQEQFVKISQEQQARGSYYFVEDPPCREELQRHVSEARANVVKDIRRSVFAAKIKMAVTSLEQHVREAATQADDAMRDAPQFALAITTNLPCTTLIKLCAMVADPSAVGQRYRTTLLAADHAYTSLHGLLKAGTPKEVNSLVRRAGELQKEICDLTVRAAKVARSRSLLEAMKEQLDALQSPGAAERINDYIVELKKLQMDTQSKCQALLQLRLVDEVGTLAEQAAQQFPKGYEALSAQINALLECTERVQAHLPSVDVKALQLEVHGKLRQVELDHVATRAGYWRQVIHDHEKSVIEALVAEGQAHCDDDVQDDLMQQLIASSENKVLRSWREDLEQLEHEAAQLKRLIPNQQPTPLSAMIQRANQVQTSALQTAGAVVKFARTCSKLVEVVSDSKQHIAPFLSGKANVSVDTLLQHEDLAPFAQTLDRCRQAIARQVEAAAPEHKELHRDMERHVSQLWDGTQTQLQELARQQVMSAWRADAEQEFDRLRRGESSDVQPLITTLEAAATHRPKETEQLVLEQVESLRQAAERVLSQIVNPVACSSPQQDRQIWSALNDVLCRLCDKLPYIPRRYASGKSDAIQRCKHLNEELRQQLCSDVHILADEAVAHAKKKMQPVDVAKLLKQLTKNPEDGQHMLLLLTPVKALKPFCDRIQVRSHRLYFLEQWLPETKSDFPVSTKLRDARTNIVTELAQFLQARVQRNLDALVAALQSDVVPDLSVATLKKAEDYPTMHQQVMSLGQGAVTAAATRVKSSLSLLTPGSSKTSARANVTAAIGAAILAAQGRAASAWRDKYSGLATRGSLACDAELKKDLDCMKGFQDPSAQEAYKFVCHQLVEETASNLLSAVTVEDCFQTSNWTKLARAYHFGLNCKRLLTGHVRVDLKRFKDQLNKREDKTFTDATAYFSAKQLTVPEMKAILADNRVIEYLQLRSEMIKHGLPLQRSPKAIDNQIDAAAADVLPRFEKVEQYEQAGHGHQTKQLLLRLLLVLSMQEKCDATGDQARRLVETFRAKLKGIGQTYYCIFIVVGRLLSELSTDAACSPYCGRLLSGIPEFRRIDIENRNKRTQSVRFEDALAAVQVLRSGVTSNISDAEKQVLMKCYQSYTKFYQEYQQRVILVAEITDKEARKTNSCNLSKRMADEARKLGARLSQRASKRNGLIFSSVREEVANMIACLFALWAQLDLQKTNVHIDKSQRVMMLQPHSTQVLALLMATQVHRQNSPLTPSLIEVLTGEGKSVCLGVLALILALMNKDVFVVCYSRLLSQRDRNEFSDMFVQCGVQQRVHYHTYDSMAAHILKDYCPDVRRVGPALVSQDHKGLTRAECKGRHGMDSPMSDCALLIDEVDVLFGDRFFGRTRGHAAILREEKKKPDDEDCYSDLVRWMWANRTAIITGGLHVVLASKEYNAVVQHAPRLDQLGLLENHIVPRHIDALRSDFSHTCKTGDRLTQLPRGYYVCGGRIWRQDIGSDEPVAHSSPYVTFLYLYCSEKGLLGGQDITEHVGLHLRCGRVLYNHIPCLFGIKLGLTGTLSKISDGQRAILDSYDWKDHVYVPSTYPKQVLQERDTRVVIGGAVDSMKPYEYFRLVYDVLEEQLNDGRAVLVLVNDLSRLRKLRHVLEAEPLKSSKFRSDNLRFLDGTLTTTEKQDVILQSTRSGAITVMTRIFGRGIDFCCHDKQLVANGGVHVLLLFEPRTTSEEVQIKGRTCRQDDPGSFEKLLFWKDLVDEFDPEAIQQLVQEMPCSGNTVNECLRSVLSDKKQTDAALRRLRELQGAIDIKALRTAAESSEVPHKLTCAMVRAAMQGDTNMAAGKLAELQHQETVSASAFHFVLALDESGSMSSHWAKLMEAVQAFLTLRAGCPNDVVSIIKYDNTAKMAVSCVSPQEALNQLPGMRCSGGGTYFEPPLKRAALEFKQRPDLVPVLIFMSDGQCSETEAKVSEALQQLVDSVAKPSDFVIHTIAFGGSGVHTTLQAMASQGGCPANARLASTGMDLVEEFRTIALDADRTEAVLE